MELELSLKHPTVPIKEVPKKECTFIFENILDLICIFASGHQAGLRPLFSIESHCNHKSSILFSMISN